MRIHCFIRNQCFTVKQQSQSSIILRTCSNKLTLQYYPFKFQFDVTFSLEQKCLTVTYEIINQDNTELYFSLGSHPTFALPMFEFTEGKCKLVFSEQENQYCQLIKNDSLFEEEFPVSLTDKTLRLTTYLFDHDALIFRDVFSSSIMLKANDKQILSLDMGTNEHLGIWAKPNSPYVCIEPWTATDETLQPPLELSERPI